MENLGYILLSLGCIVGVVGEVMILTAALHRGAILFMGCLLIPFVAWGFALTHVRKLWLPLTLTMAGCAFAFLGLRLCGCENPMEILFE